MKPIKTIKATLTLRNKLGY